MAIEKTDEALVMKQREIMEEINHLPHGGKKSLIYTLGCQQNESDSEKLSGMLKKGIRRPRTPRRRMLFCLTPAP